MNLESWQAEELKRDWKVVRRDTMIDVPGSIVMANEETGDCTLTVPAQTPGEFETKTFSFGLNGLRIVRRHRR